MASSLRKAGQALASDHGSTLDLWLVLRGNAVHLAPEKGVRPTELRLYLQAHPGVLDGRGDLETVVDDAVIAEESLDIDLGVGGDPDNLEVVKGPAVILPFF